MVPPPPSTPSDLLIGPLRLGATLEGYVAELLQPLRRLDRSGDGLDADDIAFQQQRRLAEARASAVAQALLYDLNADQKVDRTEVEASGPTPAEGRRRAQALFDRYDTDNNGVVTLAELSKPEPPSEDGETQAARLLLALDPNGDGRLTAAELDALAHAAFAAVDSDGDTVISETESAALEPRRRAAQDRRVAAEQEARDRAKAAACALPAPGSRARVLLFSAYEAQALSSVAIGDQDQETNLAAIEIEPGAEPLYLILASYKSMIWRITGDTHRLVRVAVSASARSGKVSAAGVAGVPAGKVTILEADCVGYVEGGDPMRAARAQTAVRLSLGRSPDQTTTAYSVSRVRLPSGDSVVDGRGPPPPPPGFDASAWKDVVRYWRNGVVEVDPKTATARARVEPYVVLPSQAGLAQLAGSGALVALPGSGYRVVRPIPRLPANMTGGHAVRLVLAPGVPMPPGDPGHACVVSEEGGRSLTRMPSPSC
jgi:hypothetical protein